MSRTWGRYAAGRSGTSSRADCFIAKISPDGKQLLYFSWLGGSDYQEIETQGVSDAAGNFYVVGSTKSPNFPTTPGAFQRTLKYWDGFAVKVNNNGTLSWADGDTARKTIPIFDDTTYEGDETVNLALSGPTGGATLRSLHTAVLTIADDESPGPDTDGDGLPDAWEMLYSGNLSQSAAGDPDSDGLTNAQEHAASTDPTNADTDADGLLDGHEVNLHGTGPTNPDTDGDGMSDGAEVTHGFEPKNPDQDGNGISDGLDDWDGDGIANASDPSPGSPPGSASPGGGGAAGAAAAATRSVGAVGPRGWRSWS